MVLNLKKFSKDELQGVLEKNSLIVEEISGLKPNVNLARIHLDNRLKFLFNFQGNPLKNYIHSFFRFGDYNHSYPPHFYFPRKYFGNSDSLNLSFCHEIFHNAQYNKFPELFDKVEILERINGNTRIENKIIYSIKKLVEGDAKLIENICKEKYYPNPQRNIHKWAKYFNNSVAERSYVEGKNILLENFGGDRGKINELYNKNIDELVEIFVQK